MELRKIVTEYLTTNGFDGLWNDDCGCDLNDLMPCDRNIGNCIPGYKTEGCDCGEGHDFHIGPKSA